MYISPINSTQFYQNQKPTTGKKAAVGIASLAFPGLGQAINGQWGKGALVLAATSMATIPCQKLATKIYANMLADVPEKAFKNAMKTRDMKNFAMAALAVLAIRTISLIDAVRNTKPDAR